MADILKMASTISYILAVFFLLLSVFFWIKFRIPSIIGDLSGWTAKRSIARIRENNEKTGTKTYKSSKTNIERGKLTVDIREGKTGKGPGRNGIPDDSPETGLLHENIAKDVTIGPGTGILKQEITEQLDENATLQLTDDTARHREEIAKSIGFQLLEEIVLIHTDEIIG